LISDIDYCACNNRDRSIVSTSVTPLDMRRYKLKQGEIFIYIDIILTLFPNKWIN